MGKKDFDNATKAVIAANKAQSAITTLTATVNNLQASDPEKYTENMEYVAANKALTKLQADLPDLIEEARTMVSVLSPATSAKVPGAEAYR